MPFLSALRRARPSALLVAACIFATPAVAQFGKNKVQYREFDWQIYHSPHFDIYYYPQEKQLLEKVASMAESAYDHISRVMDHQIKKPVPLIFYLTHSAFEQNNIMFNFIPEGIGAFTTPMRNRMVLPVDMSDAELEQLISHELTHAFQFDIFFEGKLSRMAASPPQWFMEGMASYVAKDETIKDQMFLRDAVVNDAVPSITQRGIEGYLSYRFGHAAFDYMEERWGLEGFRDFMYETRSTIGSRVDRAIKRAFKVEPEDFDVDFRRWLRQKYLPQLVASGEPSDFGRPFRDEYDERTEASSPAASPSGDLVASVAAYKGSIDLVVYDARKRRLIGSFAKGYGSNYQYIVAQNLTARRREGRDLVISPDGNRLAVFAKKERGRALLLFDVVSRKLVRSIDMAVEQQNGLDFSPDGKSIVFSGNLDGNFDIFTIDLASGQITNVTHDEVYDGGPIYSRDGKSILFSSTVGEGHSQLFRIDIADPTKRYRLTNGAWSDYDPVLSTDGRWIYYTSDRSGAENIFALESATGKTIQITNAVTGCFMPTILKSDNGKDRLVYTGFWKGRFDLFENDLDKVIGEPKSAPVAATPSEPAKLEKFEPDIKVSLDDSNKEKYRGFKLFLEDGGAEVGVAENQTVLGSTYLSFTDYLGDRRLITTFSSVAGFSDFDFLYINQRHRRNWSIEVFDNRDFFVTAVTSGGQVVQQRQVFRQTGAIGTSIYPFSFYHRLELGTGFISRQLDFPQFVFDENGNPVYEIQARKDNYPIVQAAIVGDTTVFANWGAVSGRRWRLSTTYGYDLKAHGTLTDNVDLDWRQYLRTSERSNFAFRVYAGYAGGNSPSPYFFGGLDTIRGFDFRSLVGNRAFFTNLEWRFPLIDVLATPALGFQGIRGRIWVDAGGAWLSYSGQAFRFWNGQTHRLVDGVSSYGWGFTVRFGPLDLNWDFARWWDFRGSTFSADNPNSRTAWRGIRTAFWIGTRF